MTAIPPPADTATHREPERLAAVHRYEILDAPHDGAFDGFAATAALAFGTPIATVSIVDTERVWFAATHGLDGVSEIGVEPGLCASAVLHEELYVVTDAALDPRTLDHPLVRGELGLRFYAAAPIVTDDGYRLGTVNVIDREARQPEPAQLEILTHLAGLVAGQLQLRLTAIRAVRTERVLRSDAERRVEDAGELIARLRTAAATMQDAERPPNCQLAVGQPCQEPAELKLADPWGDSAWGCTDHASDALMTARGVFLADHDQAAIATYLARPH